VRLATNALRSASRSAAATGSASGTRAFACALSSGSYHFVIAVADRAGNLPLAGVLYDLNVTKQESQGAGAAARTGKAAGLLQKGAEDLRPCPPTQ